MQPLPPLASELNRMIRYLAGAGAGLSLMSASTSSLPLSVIQALIASAARPNDILGCLIDGSVGILTIRPHGDDGCADLEQDFLTRLQPAMAALCEKRFGGRVTLWLRAVHRPATQIAHAPDLIGCLFDAPSTPLTISSGNDGHAFTSRTLFPRVTPQLDPFIEPIERQPALLRLFHGIPWSSSAE